MNDQYILDAREFENEQAPEILTEETVWRKVGAGNLILVDLRNEESLRVISKGAFSGRGSMKAANFAGCSNLDKIGKYAFSSDSKLKIVSLAGREKLSELEEGAFAYCCELREVRMARCKNITSIGDNAFDRCKKLTSLSVYDQAVDLFEFDINFRGYGKLKTIGMYAFRDCKSIKTADFSCSGLARIGNGAFSKCCSLEEISFTGCRCLTEIEGYAFSDCENLKCIYLSGCDNLTEIGNRVFSGCRSLEKIDLSGCHSLTEIGRGAFAGCEVLREILLPEEFFAGMTEQQRREKMNDILGYDVRFDIEREDGKYKITVDRQRQIMRRINEPNDFMPNDFMFIEDEMPRRANEEIAELMQEIELLREAELAQRGRQQPEQQHEGNMDNAEISEDEHEDSFENNGGGGNMIAEPWQAQEESEPYEQQHEVDMDNAEISEDEHEDSFKNNDWHGGNMIARPGQAHEESEPYEQQLEPQREAVDMEELLERLRAQNAQPARGRKCWSCMCINRGYGKQ